MVRKDDSISDNKFEIEIELERTVCRMIRTLYQVLVLLFRLIYRMIFCCNANGNTSLEWIMKSYRVDNDNTFENKLEWTLKRHRVNNDNNNCNYDDDNNTYVPCTIHYGEQSLGLSIISYCFRSINSPDYDNTFAYTYCYGEQHLLSNTSLNSIQIHYKTTRNASQG